MQSHAIHVTHHPRSHVVHFLCFCSDRDRSRSRSRGRSSRKSRGNWDKAPTSDGAIAAANAAAQIAAIQHAGAPPGAVTLGMPTTPGMSYPPGGGYQLPLPGGIPTLRQAKRIYVGNVQPHITEMMLRQFLNGVIMSVPGRPQSIHPEPVNTITIKPDKMFAFVEFHNVDDAVSGGRGEGEACDSMTVWL